MAKRFGGKYSPGADGAPQTGGDSYAGAKVKPAGARSNIMFVPPAVLLLTSLNDGAIALATAGIGAGLLTLAAWMLREGKIAQAAFDARKVARKPAIPRKIFAAILSGLGVGAAVFTQEPSVVAPTLFGIMTTGLHLAAFGIDPLKDKGMEGADRLQMDRVARVVDDAQAHLDTMRAALARVGDRTLMERFATFRASATKLIYTVEEDPRDLTSARKYLGVYLMGARDAAEKFAAVYTRNQSKEAYNDFDAFLTDLDQNFAAKTEKLLLDERSDMNLEIEVLRDRLAREGVTID